MQTSNNMCRKLNDCLCCDNPVNTILDLGEQPPANSYIKNIDDIEFIFPLKLNYCDRCTHLQLSHAVNPDILFRDYLYVSGTSNTLKKYFDTFVNIVQDNCTVKNNAKVLDIACNDGSQLDSFKAAGYTTYGIDPAINLYPLSSQNHNIVCDYLTAQSISQFDTKFDVIIAQNVFAHNSYPKEFLEICKDYLTEDGSIFIQTSQADMIEYGQFDTIYHEHISFFNMNSMRSLVNNVGLYLNKILKTPIHGNSYVFIINKYKSTETSQYTEKYLSKDIIEIFANNVQNSIIDLNNQIKKYNTNYLIVGYGAAAKGNTVLNYGKIKLDYIVDDNPLKHGLYTPGMKIPIVSLSDINNISKSKKIAWLPLAWNFFDEIKAKICNIRPNEKDEFIKLNFSL
jgi:2-polyprenyl-3-methyl-5-hydroxy-6-metoxy-1,4-benzoquinol methylase